MTVDIDVWLRGTNEAKTHRLEGIEHEPSAWTEADVRKVLEGMLRVMRRMTQPSEALQPIALRGLSWIVNPYESGGVVLAIEITLGAAIAGPFDIDQSRLEGIVARVLAPVAPPPAVH